MDEMLREHALGYKPDPEDRRDYPARMMLPMTAPELPWHYGYRNKLTEVRDQGHLGSCVGFACVALKEYQEKVQRPLTPFRNSSEMWVYWKAKEIDPWPTEEGTSIRAALKVLSKTGVPTEKAWPYTDVKAPQNKPPTKPAFWSKIVARWGKIGSYFRLRSVDEIRQWIYLHGPVVIGVYVGETIFNPGDDGFVDVPSRIYGGHAILINGYNDRRGWFVFKNSWGIDWGHRGYGMLPYRYINWKPFDAWGITDM